MIGLIAAEITVRLILTSEGERVDTAVKGEPRLVQALGMLRMAEQSFLDGELAGDEDD